MYICVAIPPVHGCAHTHVFACVRDRQSMSRQGSCLPRCSLLAVERTDKGALVDLATVV